jgi:hypothetical protein
MYSFRRFAGIAGYCGFMCWILATTAVAQDEATAPDIEPQVDTCNDGICLYVKPDETLGAEAQSLVEALSLRLCKRGVNVYLGSVLDPGNGEKTLQPPATGPCKNKNSEQIGRLWWTVHLKLLNDSHILVAVDHLGRASDEDLIREVPRGPQPSATAWTLALMIEEMVLPYLEPTRESAALGAGLSIIEPPEVGGVKKTKTQTETRYPTLRYIGMGLALQYLGTVNNDMNAFLVGPFASIQGLLGKRIVGSLSAGWVGTGAYENLELGIKGKASHIPIDLLFGVVMVSSKRFSLSALLGISTGFSIFQTTSRFSERQRTDVYFDPSVKVGLEATLQVYKPLAIYINGGVSFPIRIDVLQSQGQEVYRQDWIIPVMGIGLQLWI